MNADKFVVRGQTYDVLSPATFGDYIETVGAACINPSGYAENKLFLAYDDNVQKLFRATAAVAYSELLIKNTNCEPTTMAEALANALSAGGVSYDNTDSGLTSSNVQDAIDEVNGDVETVKSDLSNVDTVISENGAKNLAGPIYAISQVLNGLTISVNTNSSSDDYGTITVSGTATARTDIDIVNRNTFHLGPGAYKVSGCPSGGSANSYLLLGRTDGAWGAWADIGSGEVVNVLTSFTGFVLRIASGTVITTPIVFKPMITLASQPNSDYAHYVPYAKTNRELTEDTALTNITFTPTNSEKAFLDWGDFLRVGDVVMATFGFYVKNVTSGDSVSLGTLPVQSPTSKAVPVCDDYGVAEYAGIVQFLKNQNELVYISKRTATNMRICGTLIFKVK